MCSEQKMVQNYERDDLCQGSNLGSITERQDAFIMKNFSDNWEFCRKLYQEMLAKLKVCNQGAIYASFPDSQIFYPYHKTQIPVNKLFLPPCPKSSPGSKPYW